MSVLDVRDLWVRFRQDGRVIEAVRGVSFTVAKGETVALVGESGSGKSVTALATVALRPDSATITGSITYNGVQMVGAPEPALRKVRGNDISFIFQEPMTSLNPLHTIERQLGESLALHQGLTGQAARARIIELLTPGAFEGFFRESTDLARRDELTDERMESLGQAYSTTVDMTWVDELAARYGLEETI